VYWSPLVDRIDVPLLGRLGRRRGWMLLCQILVTIGLLGMATVGTAGGLAAIGAFALLTAFASATQDIAIDAWRIEAAADPDEVGLMTSAAQLGYRIALLVTDALIIAAAARVGWAMSYVGMAVLMALCTIATLFASEPARADVVLQQKPPLWNLARAWATPWSARSSIFCQTQAGRPGHAADGGTVPPARLCDGAHVQPVLP